MQRTRGIYYQDHELVEVVSVPAWLRVIHGDLVEGHPRYGHNGARGLCLQLNSIQ